MIVTGRKGAYFSADQRYRYILSRSWPGAEQRMLICMLNPSKADAVVDDPTIRRCIGFAEREGYGGITVVNLFALRATKPTELRRWKDPVGPENDDWIKLVLSTHDKMVCAWGAHPFVDRRMEKVLDLARAEGRETYCFGVTASGYPRHPLYLPKTAELIPYSGAT